MRTNTTAFTVIIVYGNIILFPYDRTIRTIPITELTAVTLGLVDNGFKDSPSAGFINHGIS